MTLLEKILPLLPHVAKPIQYVGHEVNAVHKSWDETAVKIGLCFPDLYEVGMSHLGLHLLYQVVNALPDFAAERLYTPWVDMQALMRERKIPLFSLESHRPASEFDILGFTLQYELSYSNVLMMLALAGVPLTTAERTKDDPLILAGGPCSYNPEPLAEIVDVFVIGDAETALPRLLAVYQEWKKRGAERSELFKDLCRLPGVYVPSLYNVEIDDAGRIQSPVPLIPEAPQTIQRALEPDIDSAEYLQKPIVPYLKTVHDRIALEIMRGCPRGCRFCQAGFIYRPKRERSKERLLSLVNTLLAASGYDEISLSSLSTGDYSQIAQLMAETMQICESEKVSLSLPSMRVSTLTEEMAAIIGRVRKTGFTIAPEAGTQRLRDVINKGITDADILKTAEEAFTSGWELLKLYFMIGLPTETDEDMEGLMQLVATLRSLGNRLLKKKVKLNVAISSFVPKAHTPFQWDAMASLEELQQKQNLLKRRLRQRTIQVKWHEVEASYLEGVFARGDRRLGLVLLEAHRLGCQFDGWNEHLDFQKWMEAFTRAEIEPDTYVFRERDIDEILPWDHIQTGVTKAYLWNERNRSRQEEATPPCDSHCRRCGVCHDEIRLIESPQEDSGQEISPPEQRTSETIVHRPKAYRLRVCYEKTGVLRFLSHRDLMRVFQRAIARIKAPISFSQGFHPHPQMAFGPALPVGMEGLQEYVDFFFFKQIDADAFREQMNRTLPTGVNIHQAYAIELQAPSLSTLMTQFGFSIEMPACWAEQGYPPAYFRRKIHEFQSADRFVVPHFKKSTEAVDIQPFISSLEILSGDEAESLMLQVSLRTCENKMMKPEEVLHLVFDLPQEKFLDCRVIRVSMGTAS